MKCELYRRLSGFFCHNWTKQQVNYLSSCERHLIQKCNPPYLWTTINLFEVLFRNATFWRIFLSISYLLEAYEIGYWHLIFREGRHFCTDHDDLIIGGKLKSVPRCSVSPPFYGNIDCQVSRGWIQNYLDILLYFVNEHNFKLSKKGIKDINKRNVKWKWFSEVVGWFLTLRIDSESQILTLFDSSALGLFKKYNNFICSNILDLRKLQDRNKFKKHSVSKNWSDISLFK